MPTQVAPSVVALSVVVAFDVYRNRDSHLSPAPSVRAHCVVQKPIAAVVVLLIFGGALAMFADLAPETVSPHSLATTGPGWTSTAVVPTGWTTHGRQAQSWADRYFGPGSSWYRYKFASGAGLSAQHLTVDALTAPTAGPLSVYPAISCYRLSVPYLQSPTPISLGHGVEATLFYANSYAAPSPVEAQWVLLTWTWKVLDHGTLNYQRVDVLVLDNATNVAGFPSPAAPGANNSVRTTFTDILRGVSTSTSPAPTRSTVGRIVRFSTELVTQQSRSAGS